MNHSRAAALRACIRQCLEHRSASVGLSKRAYGSGADRLTTQADADGRTVLWDPNQRQSRAPKSWAGATPRTSTMRSSRLAA